MFCYSEAIADGNRCLLKLMASAVSSSFCLLSDNHFCESHHNVLSFKALSEVNLAKHESLQKRVSLSGKENYLSQFYHEAWILLTENIEGF